MNHTLRIHVDVFRMMCASSAVRHSLPHIKLDSEAFLPPLGKPAPLHRDGSITHRISLIQVQNHGSVEWRRRPTPSLSSDQRCQGESNNCGRPPTSHTERATSQITRNGDGHVSTATPSFQDSELEQVTRWSRSKGSGLHPFHGGPKAKYTSAFEAAVKIVDKIRATHASNQPGGLARSSRSTSGTSRTAHRQTPKQHEPSRRLPSSNTNVSIGSIVVTNYHSVGPQRFTPVLTGCSKMDRGPDVLAFPSLQPQDDDNWSLSSHSDIKSACSSLSPLSLRSRDHHNFKLDQAAKSNVMAIPPSPVLIPDRLTSSEVNSENQSAASGAVSPQCSGWETQELGDDDADSSV